MIFLQDFEHFIQFLAMARGRRDKRGMIKRLTPTGGGKSRGPAGPLDSGRGLRMTFAFCIPGLIIIRVRTPRVHRSMKK